MAGVGVFRISDHVRDLLYCSRSEPSDNRRAPSWYITDIDRSSKGRAVVLRQAESRSDRQFQEVLLSDLTSFHMISLALSHSSH